MWWVQPAVSLLGVIVTALGAGVGLYQYRKNQLWRETEFVAQQAKEFFADSDVRSALKMLDWKKRRLSLLPEEPTLVTRELLEAALAHGDDVPRFTREQAAIRDIFDVFFTRLGNFEQFVKAKVITFAQIEPYLRYWAGLLVGQRPNILNPNTRRVIWAFMQNYGYDDAIDLLHRYDPKAAPCSSPSSMS